MEQEQTREIEERKRENAELALKHKERLEQEEKKQDDARERLEKIKEETKSVRETVRFCSCRQKKSNRDGKNLRSPAESSHSVKNDQIRTGRRSQDPA